MTQASTPALTRPVPWAAATSPPSTPDQVYIQPGFVWDRQAAYLFDIDGTILRSEDRVHYDSFFAAVQQVLGEPLVLDGVTVHGNTDRGILRDAFRLAALKEERWRPHVETIFAQMGASVTARQAEMRAVVMPGVVETLEHLRAQGAVLGVATGNIETIGWLKVAAAGLRDRFSFGGFSDGYEVRSDMIGHALKLAQAEAGPGATVCVVGDTIFDVTAARVHGLPTIAVATGNYSFEQLMEAEPEVCATSLAALLAHSGGRQG